MKKRPYEKPELMGIEALAGGESSDAADDLDSAGVLCPPHLRTCCRRTGHACPTLIRRRFGKRKKNKTAS